MMIALSVSELPHQQPSSYIPITADALLLAEVSYFCVLFASLRVIVFAVVVVHRASTQW